MVKWRDGEVYWYRAIVKLILWMVQIIHTHVHMVKWWDNEMDWYRAMVKRIWWNGADNTHSCSHGEIVKWWNGAVQIIQRWNGVMVKQLYSPSTAVGFLVPSNNGYLSRFFTSSADVSPVEEKVVSEWCRDDRLNSREPLQRPLIPRPPAFFRSIYHFHSHFHSSCHRQHHGGSFPFTSSWFLTLLTVLVMVL